MEIRRIRPDDSRMDISRIYEESWKSAYKGIVPQAYLDSIPNGHWAPHLDQPGWHTLICVDEGRAIGTTSFCESRFQQFPSWGEIISLYLLPEYAGQGYGKALLEAALCELKQLGFRDIFLWVLEENHHARLFYEKMGFNVSDAFLEDQIGGKPLREVQYTYRLPDCVVRPSKAGDKHSTDGADDGGAEREPGREDV